MAGWVTRANVRSSFEWYKDGGFYLITPILILLFCTSFLFEVTSVPASLPMPGTGSGPGQFTYSTVSGFFKQSDRSLSKPGFDYAIENFGLIDRPYDTDADFDPQHSQTQWQRFQHYVQYLNNNSPENTSYKIIYMGRHGQGVHNAAIDFYGVKPWDDHWSKLEGNDTAVWADAHLTDVGIAQARHVHDFWLLQVQQQKMELPQSYYTSPLYRCLQTADFTFGELRQTEEFPFKPMVKELLRETNGVHTCDRRSSRSVIHEAFPAYPIEEGFKENDELWRADHRETDTEQLKRMKLLLDDVFMNDLHAFISFTSHSGSIRFLLQAIGHRSFHLDTGGVIPVFVKAEKL